MPTNLPPEFYEAEQRYRTAETIPARIAALEALLGTIPRHRSTEKLRAGYRRRLARLRAAATRTHKPAGRPDSAFRIDREGAGQVVVVGLTNAGKSALVATLTNAAPEVSDAPFTTWTPTPGMMLMENVQIQLIDTPPLDRDYIEPEFLDLIRRSDLALLVVDLHTDPFQQLEDALALLKRHRIVPAHLAKRREGRQTWTSVPFLLLVNKYDDEGSHEVFDIFLELLEDDWPLLPVSARTRRNLEHLKRVVFDHLEIMRVYAKRPGQEPDLSAPLIVKRGGTVADFARLVHEDFVEGLKTARLWGSGAFDGQPVGRDYVLQDGDIVELRI